MHMQLDTLMGLYLMVEAVLPFLYRRESLTRLASFQPL